MVVDDTTRVIGGLTGAAGGLATPPLRRAADTLAQLTAPLLSAPGGPDLGGLMPGPLAPTGGQLPPPPASLLPAAGLPAGLPSLGLPVLQGRDALSGLLGAMDTRLDPQLTTAAGLPDFHGFQPAGAPARGADVHSGRPASTPGVPSQPLPAPPAGSGAGGGFGFFLFAAVLLGALALLLRGASRNLRQALDFLRPAPYIALLERPG